MPEVPIHAGGQLCLYLQGGQPRQRGNGLWGDFGAEGQLQVGEAWKVEREADEALPCAVGGSENLSGHPPFQHLQAANVRHMHESCTSQGVCMNAHDDLMAQQSLPNEDKTHARPASIHPDDSVRRTCSHGRNMMEVLRAAERPAHALVEEIPVEWTAGHTIRQCGAGGPDELQGWCCPS